MDLLLNCAGRGGEVEEEYFYHQRGRPAAGAPRVKLRRSKSLGKGPRASSSAKSQWQAPSASRVVQSMLDEVTMLREENLRLRREKEYNRASMVFNPDQERALAANLGMKWSPPAAPAAAATRPDSLALPGTSDSEASLHYAVGNVGSSGVASQRAAAVSQLYATPHRTPCTPSSSSSASQQRHGQAYAAARAPYSAGVPQQRGGTGGPIYATPYAPTVTSSGHSRSPSTASGVTSPRSSLILTSHRSSLALTSQIPRAGTPPCTPPRRDLPPVPHSRSSGTLRGEEVRAPRELPHVPVPQISMPSTLGSQCSGWSDDSGFREAGDSVNTSHYETLDHCARKGQSPRGGSGAGTPRQGLSRSQSMKSPTATSPGSAKSLVQGRPESVCVRRRISMGVSGMRSAEKAGSARNSLCEAAGGSSGAGSPVETIPKQLEVLTELIDELTLASSGQPGSGGDSETRGKASFSSSSQEELKRCLGSVLAPQLADLSRQFHVYQEEQKVRHERLVSGQQRIVELTLQSKAKVTAVQNDLMKLISQGRDRTRDLGISEDVSMLPEYITGVGLAIQDKFGIRERVGDFFRQLMNPGVVDYICLQQQELSPRALFWRLLCELSRLLQREGKVVSLISMLTACEACKISPLKCKLMPRRHQAVIEAKYSYLVDNLVAGDVLPYLHDSGLMTSELQGYVMEGAVQKGRVERLISVLPVLGDQAFPLLLSALAQSEQAFIEQELREELSRQVEEEERTQQAALARSVQNSLMAQSPDGSGQTVLSRLAGVLETSGGGSEIPSAPAATSPGTSPLAIWQILAALRASIKDLQAVCIQNSESLALLHQERSQQHSPDPRLRHLYGSDVI